MGKAKFRPHHALKVISVGVFSIVLLAIAASLLTRSKRQMKVPEIARAPEERKIDKKERIEIRGMKRDEESLEVLADRHFKGEDDLYHLEGNVKISLFKRSEGKDIILMGEEILHNEDRSFFWSRRAATVEFKDLIVESSVLEYDAKQNVFRGDEAVRFFSDSISGSARQMDYFLGDKKAELRGNVHLEFQSTLETSVPLEIDTEYFEYYVGKGRGLAQGEVDLKHGKSQAAAGFMEFRLSAGRDQIKTLFLKENVRIFLVDEFEKIDPDLDQKSLVLHGDTCLMEAGEILIQGFIDLPQVQRLEAAGSCSFRFASKAGSFTQIEGEKIAFDLTKRGKLKSLTVDNKARITEKEGELESVRTIDGQRIQIQEDKNILAIVGVEARKARIRSEDSEIEAQEIRLFLDNNDIEAEQGTKVIVYPKQESQKTSGLFSAENPIFVTAADMRYSAEDRRFQFGGGVRLWQMKETIKGREMSFNAETGAFQVRGSVESVLPYLPKGKEEEENVKVVSAAMEYDPEESVIAYSEKVQLDAKDVSMTAKRLIIALDKESGDMVNIAAHDDVVVVQKTFEGHGEEANFNIGEEIITVVGNPVLIDKDKGKTEGGKLTFYMADGRIVVENRDGDRSVTVIKS